MKFAMLAIAAVSALGQEASEGFDLRATLTGEGAYSRELAESPRDGSSVIGAARLLLYPTLKLNDHWTVTAALQSYTQPFFYSDFNDTGHRVKTDVLQASINYAQVWDRASLTVRVGELSSAFGSFLLRYDDAVNPLADMPIAYGYYAPVSAEGLAGAQIDATAGRFDGRLQLTSSSPMNPRQITQTDQYANWAGGGGYTIKQGFRVGASAFRGPYLDRQSPYYWWGELPPRDLPGTGLGLDAKFASGPWNAFSEWQHFTFSYHAMPTLTEHTGYGEVRRVLNPRWFLAARVEYVRYNRFAGYQRYETGVGYRLNRLQLAKVSYGIEQGPAVRSSIDSVVMVQLVSSLDLLSFARK